MKLLAIAGGEIKQRMREPGFMLLTIALAAFATYLAPGPGSPYSTLMTARSPIYGGSALAGTASGLDFAVFAGMFCIFALGSGFARDDRTRLSELLRSEPVSTFELVLGRALAAWCLGVAIALCGMLLLGLTLAFREGASFEPLAYARNFALLAVPAMCGIASIAVVLDILLGRWRGLLIALGLIGYIALLSISDSAVATGQQPSVDIDLSGIGVVQAEFSHAMGRNEVLDAGLEVESHPGKPVYWSGIVPLPQTVVQRAKLLAEAAAVALIATLLYRRRAGTSRRGARAVEPSRTRVASIVAVEAPRSRPRGPIGRLAVELWLRVRKNPALALCSAALFALAIIGAKPAHHWVVAGAILLPLFWIRAFGDALRPRSLDEVLGALPGGLDGEWTTKTTALAVLCALPLVGLLIGNPAEPWVWAAATIGLLVEIAWLTTTAWVFRAELLALGVVALWWYVIAFNNVPAPIDYAGLWSVSAFSIGADALLAVLFVATSQTLLRRRA